MGLHQLFDLTGRKAIITGGSRGLGLQIAEALGEYGCEVLLASRKQAELDEACAHLSRLGIKATNLAVDLTQNEATINFAHQAVDQLGQVDILVNNAGAAWGADMVDHPLEAWLKLVNLNLTSVFLLTREIGRLSMVPRRAGKVMTVASIAGLRGNATLLEQHTIAYNTTKGGLVNFTRALATEWGAHNINVNALAPGFFPSKMTKATLDSKLEQVIKMTPLGRVGGDEDLKGAALLLCSDAGRHITGQILAVDGGSTAQ